MHNNYCSLFIAQSINCIFHICHRRPAHCHWVYVVIYAHHYRYLISTISESIHVFWTSSSSRPCMNEVTPGMLCICLATKFPVFRHHGVDVHVFASRRCAFMAAEATAIIGASPQCRMISTLQSRRCRGRCDLYAVHLLQDQSISISSPSSFVNFCHRQSLVSFFVWSFCSQLSALTFAYIYIASVPSRSHGVSFVATR
jgi:hypothetical protein